MPKSLNFSKVRTYSIQKRRSKVPQHALSRPQHPGARFRDFWDGLPDLLAARQLKSLVSALTRARHEGRTVLLMFGAHLIKCGLSPIVIDLMKRGWIKALATNGASAIHDYEMALAGHTSEDVSAGLKDGSFGMARETGRFLNGTARHAARRNRGFGETHGTRILSARLPHGHLSLFATARTLRLPATVHAAMGTDIVHQQPGCDGAAWGKSTYKDFQILSGVVSDMNRGVVLNVGSAVILPEVFLKSLTVARNLGHRVEGLTAANFDMLPQYRPRMNVVQRPTEGSGTGLLFTGHHEIMLPLLSQALLENE